MVLANTLSRSGPGLKRFTRARRYFNKRRARLPATSQGHETHADLPTLMEQELSKLKQGKILARRPLTPSLLGRIRYCTILVATHLLCCKVS